MIFDLGPLALQPYRVVLILAFFPMAKRFFLGEIALHRFDWLLVASIGWAFLAYLANHGVRAIELGGIRTVEVLGAWMLGRVGVRNAEEMTRVVRTLFWMVVAMLPFAAYEAITHRPILLNLIPSSPRVLYSPPRLGLRRAQVVFSHAILYGVFVSAVVGLVWYGFNQAAGLAARVARSALIGFATIFSVSAGALLAFVVQGLLIVYELMFKRNPGRWRVFGWGVVSGYVVLDILSNRTPFHLVVDYLTFSSGAAYNRILIFRFGMDSVWAHPIFGIGLRDWARPWWMGDSVDNFWLLNAMQFGIPGFLLFAGAFVLLIRAVSRSRIDDPVAWNLRAGWLTSMGGIILAGGTVHYWTVMLSFVMFLFGTGGWFVRDAPDEDDARRGAPRPRGGAAAAPEGRGGGDRKSVV